MSDDASDVAALVSHVNSSESAPSSSEMIQVGIMQYDAETGFFI